jgi:hypothetical protein
MAHFNDREDEYSTAESPILPSQSDLYHDVVAVWKAAVGKGRSSSLVYSNSLEDSQSSEEGSLSIHLGMNNAEPSNQDCSAAQPRDTTSNWRSYEFIMSSLLGEDTNADITITELLSSHIPLQHEISSTKDFNIGSESIDMIKGAIFPSNPDPSNNSQLPRDQHIRLASNSGWHKQQLVATDDYKQLVAEIVHYNKHVTNPSTLINDKPIDDGDYVKRQFKPFYRNAKLEHCQEYGLLKKRMAEEESKEKKGCIEMAALKSLELEYNRDILDDFVDNYLEAILRPMKEKERELYDESAGLYTTLQINKLATETTSHTVLELIEEVDKQQAFVAKQATARIEEVDVLICEFETSHANFAQLWKNNYYRLRRLVAADVIEPQRKIETIERRQKHRQMPYLIMKLEMEVRSSTEKISLLVSLLDEAGNVMAQVLHSTLDAIGTAQIATLAAIVEEKKNKDAIEAYEATQAT